MPKPNEWPACPHPSDRARPRSRVRARLGAAAIVAVAAAAAAASATAQEMPEELRNRLVKRVSQVLGDFPDTRGFALRVDLPGVGSFSHAEGSADPVGRVGIAAGDVFRMASVTKTFAAVAVLKLVDQGRLDLDEPVARHVPSCPNGEQVTVRDLLAMTSGLADYSSRPEFVVSALLDPAGFVEDEIVASIAASKPEAPPGTVRRYNNSGYYLLGPIIESASGEPWQKWIARNVIAPAGLVGTSLPSEAGLPARAVAGWYYLEAPPKLGLGPWWDLAMLHPAYAGTAGCGYSTLGDLASWLDTLLAGRLLSPRSRAAQFDLQPIDDDEYEAYGLGVARFGPWIGHTGVTLGSYAWMLRHEPTGATLIVFIQCGSEIPHLDLDGLADDLSGWPDLPAN